LSKLDLETLKIAHRDDVEEDAHKKNPHDFVLWFTKSKFENQVMKWASPWGVGLSRLASRMLSYRTEEFRREAGYPLWWCRSYTYPSHQ
jgi:cysteinyl-tRNA synthetase (EC 6.1.1.16)